MHTFVPKNRSVREPVLLNVYDLSHWNHKLHGLGLGIYHSGVQIYGKGECVRRPSCRVILIIGGSEYTFGGGPTSATGIFSHPPHAIPNQLRESIPLGVTSLTSDQVG